MSDTREINAPSSLEEPKVITLANIVKQKYEEAGQGHIFDAWESLTPQQ